MSPYYKIGENIMNRNLVKNESKCCEILTKVYIWLP
jgi:hypothetical protein